jgi:hypothetical protein
MASHTQLACRRSLPSVTALPREFLIFKPGVNDSVHGPAVFDAESARSVLEAFRTHNVDGMIDLEHLALDPSVKPYDPDARGWFGLQVRADGSLWAVNVKWTADGARRLTENTQRYTSPAFELDKKSGRVLRLVNVAITALPATHDTPHLVAASTIARPPAARATAREPRHDATEARRAYYDSPLYKQRHEAAWEAVRRSQACPVNETLRRAAQAAVKLMSEVPPPKPKAPSALEVLAKRAGLSVPTMLDCARLAKLPPRAWVERFEQNEAARKAALRRQAHAELEAKERRAEAKRVAEEKAEDTRLEAEAEAALWDGYRALGAQVPSDKPTRQSLKLRR